MRRNILIIAAAAFLLSSCGINSGNPVSFEEDETVFSGSMSVEIGPDVQAILSLPSGDPALGTAMEEALAEQNRDYLPTRVADTVAEIEAQLPEQIRVRQTRVVRITNLARTGPGTYVPGDFAAMLKLALEDRGLIYIVGSSVETYDLLAPMGVDGGVLTPIRIEMISASFVHDDLRK